MNPSASETSQELRYPPVRVNSSLETLDLDTLIMRSNTPQNPQELTPLEESTYEVLSSTDEVVPLSDSIYDTSDDDGHTASVASTTPDDASIFSDDEDDDEALMGDYLVHPPEPLEQPTPEPSEALADAGGEDSTLTETPYLDQSNNSRLISMHEGPSAEHDGISAWGVSKEFTEAQLADEPLRRYECSELRLTVRAVLSERFLPACGSFKILYVGNIEEWGKKDIDSCIAAALGSSPGPSMSIMRQGQMESYGPVLASDHCEIVDPPEASSKEPGVTVMFDDATRLDIGSQRTYSTTESARLPDLVVFWYPHPRMAAPEVDKFSIAHESFARHDIPCLHIANGRRFHHPEEAVGDATKSLRICVEGRRDTSSKFEHQEVIPIDLYTLMNLDPSQLNRHLAALGVCTAAPEPSKASKNTKACSLRSIITPHAKRLSGSDSASRSARLKLGLAVGLLASFIAVQLFGATYPSGLNYSTASQSSEQSTIKIESLFSPYPASITTPIQAAVSQASSAALKVTPRELTIVSPPQQDTERSTKPEKSKSDKLGGFQIQTTSEHQFVLRPSKSFISRKGKPQLQIQVSRDAKDIPINYVRTKEGAYIVDLDQEYPDGLFNVSIATHSKPLMQQSFAINLGHNKTIFAQFVGLVKSDIATTRQELRDVSSVVAQWVQAGLIRTGDGPGEWKKKVERSSHDMAHRLQDVRRMTESRVATGAAVLRDMPEATWLGLRKVTAPARTSKAALRARNNAFRIRCGFERAVGLSSKDHGEKKTQSCKKVGW